MELEHLDFLVYDDYKIRKEKQLSFVWKNEGKGDFKHGPGTSHIMTIDNIDKDLSD